MCIIIAKKSGIGLPSEEIFDNCYTSNRDGIGFSFARPGQHPTIVKGFQNVKKLMSMIDRCKITEEHNVVIHFRLGTHGHKDQGNCHPFPVSGDYNSMRLLNCTCECSIAHNGVFNDVPKHDRYSDTMKFIGGLLAAPGIVENLESKPVKDLLKGYCGFSNKLAFLSAAGLTTIGSFEEENGVLYSNHQFKGWGGRENNCNTHGWDENSQGQRWCYTHKRYDDCTWCIDHRTHDECEFKAREKNKILLIDTRGEVLTAHKCLWCTIADSTVKYCYDAEGYLCEACKLILDNNGLMP